MNYDITVGPQVVRMRSSGTGRPLVMIHDLGSSAASFDGLLSTVVAAGQSPVAMDLPGCGHSDTLETHCLAAVVDHVEAVIGGFCDDQVDLIGRGFGGYLALSLAARRPAFVGHVIVEDPLLPALHNNVTPRMGSAMAVRGALTTIRRGRLLQNVSGYGRAKALLAEVTRPDDQWWRALAQVSADVLILDGRRSNRHDREQIMHLTGVLSAGTRGNLSAGYGVQYRTSIVDFLTRDARKQ